MELINVFEQIKRFNADSRINYLHSMYESNTFLSCLSTSRREQSHSTFLAELFKEDSFHGAGTLPLQLLLEAVLSRAIKQNTCLAENPNKKVFFPSLKSAIMARSLSISDIEVSTEESFSDTQNSGRVDIYISCRVKPLKREDGKDVQYLNIIIENKVYSKEQDSQTEKYYKHFNTFLKNNASNHVDVSKSRGGPRARYNLYVYLTPNTPQEIESLTEPVCKCKEFVQICYQDILDHVLVPLLSSRQLLPRASFFIEEYCRSLGVSFENIESCGERNIKANTTIMAIRKDSIKDIRELWNDYKELFIASVNEKNNRDDADEDTCATTTNKRTMYIYSGQQYNMGRLVEAVIYDHLPNYKLDEINEIFKEVVKKIIVSGADKTSSYFAINNVTSTKDGHNVAVFKAWSEDGPYKFSDFREIAKQRWHCTIQEHKDESYSKDDSIMLIEFYNKHEKLIRTVLEILAYSGKADTDIDAIMNRTKSHRNRDTYSVTLRSNNETCRKLSWGRLILTVLKDYLLDNSDATRENLCYNFGLKPNVLKEYKAEGKYGYSGYFEDEEDQLTLSDNKVYVVLKGYSKETIENFIKKATEMQYRIDKSVL